MKASEMKKNKQVNIRINEQLKNALTKENISVQSIIDAYLNDKFKVKAPKINSALKAKQ